MNSRLESIINLYTEYISKDDDSKLHAGELLAEAAQLLLNMNNEFLGKNTERHRLYLMKHIAMDLLQQSKDMQMTRQYDMSPKTGEYTLLAWELMYAYYDKKPNRELIPYLDAALYIKRQNQAAEKYAELSDLFSKCIELEKDYLN